MKILTIGRGENCHIVYDNPLVSRQHAILKISSLGRIEIKDQSTNGTSINGIPMKKGRFCKVSRKDVITFAGVSQLDWKEVPDPAKPYKIICLCLLGIAIVLGAYFLFFGNGNGGSSTGGSTLPGTVDTSGIELPVPQPKKATDSLSVKVDEALKSMSADKKRGDKAKKEQKDKLESSAREQAQRDSLNAAAERQQKKAEEEQKQKDSLNSIPLL